jgi:hypothetical protein
MDVKAETIPLGIEFSKINESQKALILRCVQRLVPIYMSWDNVLQHWIHSRKLVIFYLGEPSDVASYKIAGKLPNGLFRILAVADPSKNKSEIWVDKMHWRPMLTPTIECITPVQGRVESKPGVSQPTTRHKLSSNKSLLKAKFDAHEMPVIEPSSQTIELGKTLVELKSQRESRNQKYWSSRLASKQKVYDTIRAKAALLDSDPSKALPAKAESIVPESVQSPVSKKGPGRPKTVK